MESSHSNHVTELYLTSFHTVVDKQVALDIWQCSARVQSTTNKIREKSSYVLKHYREILTIEILWPGEVDDSVTNLSILA